MFSGTHSPELLQVLALGNFMEHLCLTAYEVYKFLLLSLNGLS